MRRYFNGKIVLERRKKKEMERKGRKKDNAGKERMERREKDTKQIRRR